MIQQGIKSSTRFLKAPPWGSIGSTYEVSLCLKSSDALEESQVKQEDRIYSTFFFCVLGAVTPLIFFLIWLLTHCSRGKSA